MFSKLFHKKAIGFKFLNNSIKYALITFNKNKLIVDEAQLFNINCKTALHRLQHLLINYPSVFVIDSSESLLSNGPQDVLDSKDRGQIVKNKIESLIENRPVSLNLQSHVKKKNAPFLILKESSLISYEKKLQTINLNPQKIILSTEALLSLNHFFSLPLREKILIYMSNDTLELNSLAGNKLCFSFSFKLDDLSTSSIEKRLLRFFYTKNPSNNPLSVHLFGSHPSIEEISKKLEEYPFIHLENKSYTPFEKDNSNFLVEIGAAISLLKEQEGGFKKPSFSSIIKLYKKPLFANLLLLSGIFFVSSLFWNYKYAIIQNQNNKLYNKNIAQLCEKAPNSSISTLDPITHIEDLLKKKKNESPTYLFHPNTLSVTDTFTWLSEIYQEIQTKESYSPFIIESFKYSINTPLPSKNNPSLSKVKVSFSFSADSSLAARVVYDKIIKAKKIVDTNKKMEWNYQNDQYHISFFLKDNILKGKPDVQ